MNTTPEKLAQVLNSTRTFSKANPSAANQNTRGNDYQATDTDYVSGKAQWFRWALGSTLIGQPAK